MKKPRTYWLSFANPDRPEGQQHLGSLVVDVDHNDRARVTFNQAFTGGHSIDDPEKQWFLAAVRKAHALKLNPGGQVQGALLTSEQAKPYPRDVLLTEADVKLLEAAPGRPL